MGFSASDAEDLAHEAFVTFLDTIDRFEGRAKVSTWLFGILHHKAQERRRSHVREELSDSVEELFNARFDAEGSWIKPPTSADRLMESREVADALRDCLTGLPDPYREVFQLRVVEELSPSEVGKIVGCTINHIGVLLHRARLRLRACLDSKGWGHSP